MMLFLQTLIFLFFSIVFCYKVVYRFLCGVFFLWLITVICFVCVAFFLNMFNKLLFVIFFCVFLSKDIFQCHSNIKSKIHLKYRFIHWREEEEQPTMEKYCGVLLLLSLLPYCCCSCWCVLWRIVLPCGWGQYQNTYREERVNCFLFSFFFSAGAPVVWYASRNVTHFLANDRRNLYKIF